MNAHPPVRLSDPAALVDEEALESVFGALESVVVRPFAPTGRSGAVLQRVDVHMSGGGCESLVLKRIRISEDVTAYRTDDLIGRQAALLSDPRFQSVWDLFVCPYRAYAMTEGEVGLLMTDLSAWLLPDVNAPLELVEEERLLSALARLHARFWESEALEAEWLARPTQLMRLLGPEASTETTARPAEPLIQLVREGWARALAHLPPPVRGVLCRPAEELARVLSAELPETLLHGDSKVANFAITPEGVAAFDWSLVGRGPCTVDLGWYLAVNSGRLARPKLDVLAHYRSLLEASLDRCLAEAEWRRFVAFAIAYGARMLMWEKALGLASGGPSARDEWDWWVGAIEQYVLSAKL
jgi:hypothetical protein